MEEDRKWLEDYVKKDREVRGKTEFESDFDQFCERHCKAIENILKENENLKQAIEINKDLYQEVCNKNKQLEELVEYLRRSCDRKEYSMLDAIHENNCIPTSLIKEIRDKAELEDYYTLPNVIDDLNKVLGDEK